MTDEIKNNRVTTREFYNELIKMREDNRKTERRILDKIDNVASKFATKEEVSILRKRIWGGEAVLSVVFVLVATFSRLFGRE